MTWGSYLKALEGQEITPAVGARLLKRIKDLDEELTKLVTEMIGTLEGSNPSVGDFQQYTNDYYDARLLLEESVDE